MRSLPLLVLLPCAALLRPCAALADEAPGWGELARQTGEVLAWPLRLQPAELAALGGGAIVTAALLRADTRLYDHVEKVSWTLHHRSLFDYTLLAGDGLVDLGVFAAFALGGDRGRRTALAGGEALLAAGVTSTLLKHIFRVARPQTDPERKHYFDRFSSDAFPSGHSMAAFSTATVIAAEYPAAAPFAYGAASLVGFSVMKRGWHWPSDVLAGATLGVVIGRVSSRVAASAPAAPGGPALSGAF